MQAELHAVYRLSLNRQHMAVHVTKWCLENRMLAGSTRVLTCVEAEVRRLTGP